MTGTNPSPPDDEHRLGDGEHLLAEVDVVEERRSRLRRIGRLFGGMLAAGTGAALVVALAIALLARLGPKVIVFEPGTTYIETPEASSTATSEPSPVETITLRPSRTAPLDATP